MRFLLVVIGLLAAAGCGDSGRDIEQQRTVFVEVTSVPSGLPMRVSFGNSGFDAETPIARNARATVFCSPLTTPGLSQCVVVAVASVESGDPRGKRVTMCLTEAGERDCATSNDGAVSVRMTVD